MACIRWKSKALPAGCSYLRQKVDRSYVRQNVNGSYLRQNVDGSYLRQNVNGSYVRQNVDELSRFQEYPPRSGERSYSRIHALASVATVPTTLWRA
jgi:hypothetical protein